MSNTARQMSNRLKKLFNIVEDDKTMIVAKLRNIPIHPNDKLPIVSTHQLYSSKKRSFSKFRCDKLHVEVGFAVIVLMKLFLYRYFSQDINR